MAKVRDQYAELYVAGILADAGWDLYFPRRDKGFDMIAMKKAGERLIIRPVQVKGLYPTHGKKDKQTYGYAGRLSLLHDDMILALVFFDPTSSINAYVAPVHIAWMPREAIKLQKKKGFRCHPARIKNGQVKPRRDSAKYFDEKGQTALESPRSDF